MIIDENISNMKHNVVAIINAIFLLMIPFIVKNPVAIIALKTKPKSPE